MARKKKIKPTKVVNETPKSIKGLKKLKVGDIVLYRTSTLIDKAEVIEVDKKENTAKLSNNVVVSRGILDNGNIMKLGVTNITCLIKIWDDSCDAELEIFKAKRDIRDICISLQQLSNGNKMDKSPDEFIKFRDKLVKSYNKLPIPQ